MFGIVGDRFCPLTDMTYDTPMDRHPDEPVSRPSVVRVAVPEINANAGMQIALTVLALAALPISAWLYISSYVEERVDVAIERQSVITQGDIRQQQEKIEDLQAYMTQLCGKVRMLDPTFSCLSKNEIRYRFNRYER